MVCINCERSYVVGSKNYYRVIKNGKCLRCGENPNIYLNKKLLAEEYSPEEIATLEKKFSVAIA